MSSLSLKSHRRSGPLYAGVSGPVRLRLRLDIHRLKEPGEWSMRTRGGESMAKLYCKCHGYVKGSADDKRVHKGKQAWGYWRGPKPLK